MTHTTEQERADTTVFKRLLNDYADCLRNGDFQGAGAAFLAVVAEYQQAARRAPAVPTRKQIEQYLYEQGAVTVSRDVAEAAGLARLAGKMQSAPAVPVPQFSRIAQKKLDYLLEAGEAITGYAIENKDGRRGAIDCHGFVYWWQDAAAPQPPEADMGIPISAAAPVQMPEPFAYVEHHKAGDNLWFDCPGGKHSALYTEQQVRDLLAAHGITGCAV